jgi:hypothetical protein
MTAAGRCVLGFGLVVLGLGCSGRESSLPSLYPVKGVVMTEAGKPYSAGAVQFRPDNNQDVTVTGDIAADGTFTLRTLKGNERAEGAPAGTYEVAIVPPRRAGQRPPFATFTLPRKYQIEAHENELEIKADP